MPKTSWLVVLLLCLAIPGCDPAPAPLPPATATPEMTGVSSLPPPAVTATATIASAASFSGGFGIDYCGDDLPACAALGATWSRHTGVITPTQAKIALDSAAALQMRLVLRMNQGDWGWNGQQFEMGILETMRPIFDHPALIGFYGLHEPLERFTMTELRIFYRQYRDIVTDPQILLWHDIMRIPADFSAGICDLCGVAANPHIFSPQTGEPLNDWRRTDPRLEEALANLPADSGARICVLVQVYGGDGRGFLRMPEPAEYQENVRRIVEEYGIRCLANYAFYHNAYSQTLGGAGEEDLQTAVAETAVRYFGQP